MGLPSVVVVSVWSVANLWEHTAHRRSEECRNAGMPEVMTDKKKPLKVSSWGIAQRGLWRDITNIWWGLGTKAQKLKDQNCFSLIYSSLFFFHLIMVAFLFLRVECIFFKLQLKVCFPINYFFIAFVNKWPLKAKPHLRWCCIYILVSINGHFFLLQVNIIIQFEFVLIHKMKHSILL